MNKVVHHWGAYIRNQEAVAQAIARKEYQEVIPTGVGMVDEFFALMEQVGILARLRVAGVYQRRLIPLVLLVATYSVKVIIGLSSLNQLPTHLFRDAGLLRRIGYTARQLDEGFCKRGKGKALPIHKNTVGDALGRLTEEESRGIFDGSVQDLTKARLVKDTVFSLDGMEMHTTKHYPGAGHITSTKEVTDKWGRMRTVTSTRYGHLLLSLWGVDSNTVAAADVDKIGTTEHLYVLPLVRRGKAAGLRIKILLMDGGFCVGGTLWRLKHQEKVDFIVPADSNMCITEDARSLAQLAEGSAVEENKEFRAVGVKGLTTYPAYQPPKGEKRRGPKATLNAVVVTRWKGEDVPVEEQTVLLTTLPVNHPLYILELYRKRAEMENTLHRDLKQGWYIEHFPNKQYLACLAHIYLTLTLYNVSCAYKTERGQKLAGMGIRRLRAEHLGDRAFLLIVYTDTEFGVFDIEEFACLSGNPPRRFHCYKP